MLWPQQTDTHATMYELLEVVFSVRSGSRLYNEDQLSLRYSPETAVKRVEEVVERKPGSRGTSTVGSRYHTEQ
jgi:hypothetical protein